MEIEELYQLLKASDGVSIDTRTITQNQLFFAISGERFDGNQYAEKALAKGAKAAIVSDLSLIGELYIYVQDTLKVLQKLARHHRNHFDIPILALTGSNGKTTTKELLSLVLSQKYNALATKGNLNNHLGVPLTLLRIKSVHDMAIIEMGANHLSEIASYCEIADPTHGAITNIGRAHIGEFGGFQQIIKAKSELFEYLIERNRIIFFNKNEKSLHQFQSYTNTILIEDNERIYINCIATSPSIEFEIKYQNKIYHGTSHLGGDYNFSNIQMALFIGLFFGVDIQAMVEVIETYIPDNSRSQILKTDRNTIYLDAYNANPSSMMLALKYFLSLEVPNKILILGDMKELGEFADEEHQKITNFIQQHEKELSGVYYVGEHFSRVNAAFKNVQKLVNSNSLQGLNDTHIFIKGSRSERLENLLSIL